MNIADIGKRVRRARRKAGMSQAELAHAVGYSAANPISKLESGKFATVDIRLLYKIADVTGVSVGFLAADSALALPDNGGRADGRSPSADPDWHSIGETLKHMLSLLEELLERLSRLESRSAPALADTGTREGPAEGWHPDGRQRQVSPRRRSAEGAGAESGD